MALEYEHYIDSVLQTGETSASVTYDPVNGDQNGDHTLIVTDTDSGRSETFGPITIDVQGGIGDMVVETDFTVA